MTKRARLEVHSYTARALVQHLMAGLVESCSAVAHETGYICDNSS